MSISRRELIIGGGIAVASSAVGLQYLLGRPNGGKTPPVSERPKELAYLTPAVNRTTKWGPGNLFEFVNSLSEKHLDTLGKSLEIAEFSGKNKPQRIEAVHREILWQSSNALAYQFKSLEKINYHDIVIWCAGKVGIPNNEATFTSTFDLELRILKSQFVEVWDKLDKNKREQLLSKIDPNGEISNKSAIAAMSGSAALAALSTTVYFTGFAFYTTMSVVICTVASWFGVTLPFAAYMTASSTVAVLSGPIGWAIGAVLLATAAAWAGQADVRKTTSTIMQIHSMKAGALYCSGIDFGA